MSTVEVQEFEGAFVIHYGTEHTRINAYTLASSIVAFADAIKEANSIINPGFEVEIVVEAVGPGSFKAKIKTIYSGLDNLFTKQNLQAIGLNIIASYIFVHTLAPDTEINVNVDGEQVVIEQGDKTIIIPKDVHDSMKEVQKSEKFRQDIGKAFTAIEKDKEIQSLGITPHMEDEEPLIKINRDQFYILSREIEFEDDNRELIEVAHLQIKRAILERSKRLWEFVWRGVKIPAPVTDNKFYDDFFAHRVTIAPGDSLKVKLKIHQTKDPDTGIYTNNKYEVIEVLELIPRMSQTDADL